MENEAAAIERDEPSDIFVLRSSIIRSEMLLIVFGSSMIPYFTLYYIAFGWGALSAMSQLVLVYHLACIELNPCMPQRLIDIALQVNLRQRYEEKIKYT